MSRKISKRFSTTYTKFKWEFSKLTKKFEPTGKAILKLQVEGIAYMDPTISALDEEEEKYAIDIETVSAPGFTMLEVLNAEIDMYDVETWCVREASLLFTDVKAA